jgi:hypothetical protein
VVPIHGPDGPAPGSAKRDDGHSEAGDLHEKVWELERRLEKHAVTIQALFALLSARGVSAEALTEEMHRVEQDKAHAAQKTCAKCGHVLGRRQIACVYCGQARVVESPFELL